MVIESLGLPARALIRDNENEYAKLNLDDPGKSDSAFLAAIANTP